MTCGIYKLTFPDGTIYIGQSFQIEIRLRQHKKKAKKCFANQNIIYTNILSQYFQKYNWYNIIVNVIEECDKIYLNSKEVYYIDLYDSFNKGANSTSGGCGVKCKTNNTGKYGGPQSQPFYIDNIRYVSILDASTKLQIPPKTIHNRLNSNNIKYASYIYEDKNLIPERKKPRYNILKNNTPILIDNIEYISLTSASNVLNIPISTINYRINSKNKKFDNYKYINKEVIV